MVDANNRERRGLDRELLLGIVALIALLVGSELVTFFNVRRLNSDAEWVNHTYQVLGKLETILSTITEAESGHRGFIITDDRSYLESYEQAMASIPGMVDEISLLTSDNPDQQPRIRELRERVDARIGTLKETLSLKDSEGFEAAQRLMRTNRGKADMDALQRVVSDMEQEERELLAERAEKSQAAYYTSVTSGIVTAWLGVLAVCAFTWLLWRHLRARAAAAAELWDQRERFRATLASIGDAVITTDTAGRVTFMNPVAESLTGWKWAEAGDVALTDVMRIINEHTRAAAVNPVGRVLQEGVVVGLANHTLLIRKDGNETPIDDSAAPIFDSERTLTGCVLVFRDITERKQAEAEINRLLADEKQRGEQLKKLTDAALTLNSATTRESVVGVVKAEALALFEAEHADVLLDGEASDPPGRGVRVPLIARSGQPFGYLQLIAKEEVEFSPADETILVQLAHMAAVAVQNAQLYEELRTANDRKNEFLATLAHELRNPLAPIRNSLALLQMSETDEAMAQECRTIIDRQVVQMVRLIDDLLDISRISRGKIEMRKEHVDLREVVATAIEASKPLLESHHHEFATALPPEPVMVDADATRLAQVISNLLNNAAKYTDPGGRIGLVVEQFPETAVIRVRDNGIGIPPAMLGQVFEMFTQVDKTLERSQSGLGIGLTLVRRIVEMHGGNVEAHSAGEEKGSEFVVRLPLAAETGANDAAQPKLRQTVSGGRGAKRRILAVDDNQDAVNSVALMLRLKGHEVQTAYDGIEAVDAAATFKPDVVLLDIGLPRLNGYEVAQRIRQLPHGDKIVLIAVTGWGQEEDRRRSSEAGFDFHLVKPVDPARLEQLLAEADRPRE